MVERPPRGIAAPPPPPPPARGGTFLSLFRCPRGDADELLDDPLDDPLDDDDEDALESLLLLLLVDELEGERAIFLFQMCLLFTYW